MKCCFRKSSHEDQQAILKPGAESSSSHLLTLVVDLDETIIHSDFKEIPEFQLSFPYAEPIYNWLNQSNYLRGLYTREHCFHENGSFVKDLKQLGRKLSKIILLDSSPVAQDFYPMNTLPISTWHSKKSDSELLKVKELLQGIQHCCKVPTILKKVREKMKINFGISYNEKVAKMSKGKKYEEEHMLSSAFREHLPFRMRESTISQVDEDKLYTIDQINLFLFNNARKRNSKYLMRNEKNVETEKIKSINQNNYNLFRNLLVSQNLDQLYSSEQFKEECEAGEIQPVQQSKSKPVYDRVLNHWLFNKKPLNSTLSREVRMESRSGFEFYFDEQTRKLNEALFDQEEAKEFEEDFEWDSSFERELAQNSEEEEGSQQAKQDVLLEVRKRKEEEKENPKENDKVRKFFGF